MDTWPGVQKQFEYRWQNRVEWSPFLGRSHRAIDSENLPREFARFVEVPQQQLLEAAGNAEMIAPFNWRRYFRQVLLPFIFNIHVDQFLPIYQVISVPLAYLLRDVEAVNSAHLAIVSVSEVVHGINILLVPHVFFQQARVLKAKMVQLVCQHDTLRPACTKVNQPV